MNDFESQIAAELRARADQMRAQTPLAEGAKRRAKAIRRRRQLAAGTVAAAVGIALPLAFSVGDAPQTIPVTPVTPPGTDHSTPKSSDPSPQPTPSPTEPEMSGVEQTDDATSTLTLSELPAGDSPAISWLDGLTLHPLEGEAVDVTADMYSPTRLGGDLIGSYFADSGSGTIIQDPDGTVTRFPGSGPVVSQDRRLIARYDQEHDQVVFSQSGGGTQPDPIDGVEDGSMTPAGFLDENTVVSNVVDPDGRDAGVVRQTSSSGNDSPWPELISATAVSQSAQLVVGITEFRGDFEIQTSLFGSNSSEPLWSTWEYGFDHFSPSGGYLVGSDAYGDGIGDSAVVVVDAATGDLVHRFEAPEPGFIGSTAFEDDEHILIIVTDSYEGDGSQAIVRCGFDGSCELATPLRPYREDGQRTYGLGLQP